jgi:hypothetical protein
MPALQKQSISVTAKVITVFEIHNRPLRRQYASFARYQAIYFIYHYHQQLYTQIT